MKCIEKERIMNKNLIIIEIKKRKIQQKGTKNVKFLQAHDKNFNFLDIS